MAASPRSGQAGDGRGLFCCASFRSERPILFASAVLWLWHAMCFWTAGLNPLGFFLAGFAKTTLRVATANGAGGPPSLVPVNKGEKWGKIALTECPISTKSRPGTGRVIVPVANTTLPGSAPKPGANSSLFPRACTTKETWQPQNVEAEFRLDCNAAAVAAPGRDVFGVWHVGLLGNWQEIVADQLKSLTTCGLLSRAKRMFVVVSSRQMAIGGAAAAADAVAAVEKALGLQQPRAQGLADITVLPSPATQPPWEASSVMSTAVLCNGSADALVYYIHDKGASKYRKSWYAEKKTFWGYANSLYWRKYMEYFVIENYQWCANAVAGGYYTCGVDWRGNHYSGTMWWARCEYILTLPHEIPTGQKHYTDSEMWIGRSRCPGKHTQLHDGQINLYMQLIHRDMYARTPS